MLKYNVSQKSYLLSHYPYLQIAAGRFLIFIQVILVCSLPSCSPSRETSTDKTISVSILPQKYFVEAIAGDKVKVNVMIPPGASHSSYEPTARQMNSLVGSQAYLKIGYLDFELAWLPRFIGVNTEMKVFDLSEGIELIKGSCNHLNETAEAIASEDEAGIDPHIWMSPRNVKTIAHNILNSLISLYPEDSAFFRSNYKSFLLQVENVDSMYVQNSVRLKGLSFIIYHPALAYLARDYGMEQIALEFDGKEPPPAHIKAIIDLAREKNIHTIFVQKQLSIDNSRSLASEIDAVIIPVDPLDENWKDQMISILNQILNEKNP
jgi:zinc transport system substrate-binding protein